MSSQHPRTARTGGRLLIDALRLHGVDRLYCVAGESFLAALDALYDTPEIQLVVCRHEGAAANMAEADGKLTGRPGVCFVTRGPGATHASIGVHTAFQDSTPMLLLIGQVPRGFAGREAFQEIDLARMFGPVAKWAAQVEKARAIPAVLARAFRTATTGRPGPVVLSFPEDVLREEARVADSAPRAPGSPRAPTAGAMARLREMLKGAERPLVILGGGGWTEAGLGDLQAFVEANSLPVVVSFRRQHLFDNDHPNYAGHLTNGLSPQLAAAVKEADLILAVGTRLGELSTRGYTLLTPPRPSQKLVHILTDRKELGRVYQPSLGITADLPVAAKALRRTRAVARPEWASRLRQMRESYESFSRVAVAPGDKFNMAHVVAAVEPRLPPEAIITNGAGNYSIWVHRFHRYRRFHGQLAPTSGAMGYGVPAAIAAKFRHPDRPVVCFAGDGDFLMYPQEMITAMRYGLAVIFIVADNRMYGTIRMHQERVYPGRPSGTDLVNPDFAALARSFGLWAATATSAEEFGAAFDQALLEKGPSLIDVKVDPARLAP